MLRLEELEVKLWRSLQGHGGNVVCVRFSQVVSEFVCSTATDRQARVWSVYGADCLYVLDHDSIVTSCSFNSDCSLLVTGCLDKTLCLWKLPMQMVGGLRVVLWFFVKFGFVRRFSKRLSLVRYTAGRKQWQNGPHRTWLSGWGTSVWKGSWETLRTLRWTVRSCSRYPRKSYARDWI